MVEYLYTDFFLDPEKYVLSQMYWQDLWEAIEDKKDWIQPWLQEFQDGNPIFTAWSPKLRRGIRIIQYNPPKDSESLEFYTWKDCFREREDPESIEELVISCALSKETARKAFELIEEWM